MEKRKILFILPSLTRGGQERAALRIADMLGDMFIAVFASLHIQKNEYDCPYPRYDIALFRDDLSSFYPLKAFQILAAFIKAKRKLRRFVKEGDFLFSMSFGWMANCMNILSRRKNKTIISIRNSDDLYFSKRFIVLLRSFYKKADTTICLSEGIRHEMPHAYRLPKEKFTAMYNPFDVEKIRGAAKEKPSFLFSSPTIVAIGRLSLQKGFDILLHVFQKVTEALPGTQLVLIGGGREEAKLRALANDLGVGDFVTFCGVQANPFPLIAQCDVCVCSSYYEGLSNVIIESMICGLPVVSVDCKYGPREILAPNSDILSEARGIEYAEYGVLTPRVYADKGINEQHEAIDCFSQAIIKMLTDEKLAEHYRKQSGKRASDFGEESIKMKFFEILSALQADSGLSSDDLFSYK